MSKITARLRIAARFEIENEYVELKKKVSEVTEQAIKHNQLSSSRYPLIIMQICVKKLHSIGEVLWRHAEEELKSDVFFVLRANEDEILREIIDVLENTEEVVAGVFRERGLNVARQLGMEDLEELKPLRQQKDYLELFYTVQIQRLFSVARGANG